MAGTFHSLDAPGIQRPRPRMPAPPVLTSGQSVIRMCRVDQMLFFLAPSFAPMTMLSRLTSIGTLR
jgi:hypothetical protein